MSELTELYQEIILDHNKYPRNYGSLIDFTAKGEGNNPLCGDEVTVYWKMGSGAIEAISFQARGCAISQASASMMTRILKGKSVAEAQELFQLLRGHLTQADGDKEFPEELGDLAALAGVRKYPARIKCATLAWHALFDKMGGSAQGRELGIRGD